MWRRFKVSPVFSSDIYGEFLLNDLACLKRDRDTYWMEVARINPALQPGVEENSPKNHGDSDTPGCRAHGHYDTQPLTKVPGTSKS
jgi:hypothetical protein